jgi:hypothetical protein
MTGLAMMVIPSKTQRTGSRFLCGVVYLLRNVVTIMAVERVSPMELRKALLMVDSMTKAGIGFIPVPYANEQEKAALVFMCDVFLEKLAADAEVVTI